MANISELTKSFIMDNEGDTFSISLWAGMGGVVLGGLVALALYLYPGTNFLAWLMYVGAPCFFGLGISALVAGLLERQAKFRKVGLVISVLVILLAIAAVFWKLYLDFDGIFVTVYVFFPWIVIPAMAVFAGIIAVALKKWQLNVCIPMLILWLIPIGFVIAYLLFLRIDGLPSTEGFTAAFALLFGPWATLVAKIGVWPNAGEFFHLPLAVGLTLALAATSTVVLKTKNKGVAGLSLILFMGLVFSWFAVGYGQLINCHE
jgi:hypothetical protein